MIISGWWSGDADGSLVYDVLMYDVGEVSKIVSRGHRYPPGDLSGYPRKIAGVARVQVCDLCEDEDSKGNQKHEDPHSSKNNERSTSTSRHDKSLGHIASNQKSLRYERRRDLDKGQRAVTSEEEFDESRKSFTEKPYFGIIPPTTKKVDDTSTKNSDAKSKEENKVPPALALAGTLEEKPVAANPLGDARRKVQEEIGNEFATMMASGTLCANEAATLATKKVMQEYVI
ncbi:hypothetical protein Tco_0435785 [Tanacetum coccineum]